MYHLYVKSKKNANKSIYKTETDLQTQKIMLGQPKGMWGGTNQKYGINRHKLLYLKQIINKDLLHNSENYIHYLQKPIMENNLQKMNYYAVYLKLICIVNQVYFSLRKDPLVNNLIPSANLIPHCYIWTSLRKGHYSAKSNIVLQLCINPLTTHTVYESTSFLTSSPILGLIMLLLFFFIYFYQLEANYFTILQWFLSYIDMNQPWIYMYSPS